MKKILLLVLITFLASCSTAVKEQVKEDRMSVGTIDKAEMISKMRESIERIPGITKDQTDKILNLHHEILEESAEVNRKIYQSKVLLFKYLAESKDKEMKVVKQQIQALYAKKLDIMLGAFDRVKEILGKNSHKIMLHDDFMLYHGFSQERF